MLKAIDEGAQVAPFPPPQGAMLGHAQNPVEFVEPERQSVEVP
jgi:hypothetical protein